MSRDFSGRPQVLVDFVGDETVGPFGVLGPPRMIRDDDGVRVQLVGEVAVTVTVDEQPLDKLGEMFAILDGRHTFDLAPARGKTCRPGQHNLYIREPWHVDSSRTWGTVHALHRCERRP